MPSLITPLTAPALESAAPLSDSLNALLRSTNGSSVADQAADPFTSYMTFSSEARRRLAFPTPARLSSTSVREERALRGERIGTSENEGLYGVLPYINMKVNPNNVEFNQPKRFTRQDTTRGTVIHHFTNDKRQNNDLLTINFQGNTGNISAHGLTEEDRARHFERFRVWHNLWQLTREEVLLSDGTPNSFYILYISPLFPSGITFIGTFSAVLKFTESAKKPNSRDYSMEFLVQNTEPDMNVISQQLLQPTGGSTNGI